eukprot:gene8300-203_t
MRNPRPRCLVNLVVLAVVVRSDPIIGPGWSAGASLRGARLSASTTGPEASRALKSKAHGRDHDPNAPLAPIADVEVTYVRCEDIPNADADENPGDTSDVSDPLVNIISQGSILVRACGGFRGAVPLSVAHPRGLVVWKGSPYPSGPRILPSTVPTPDAAPHRISNMYAFGPLVQPSLVGSFTHRVNCSTPYGQDQSQFSFSAFDPPCVIRMDPNKPIGIRLVDIDVTEREDRTGPTKSFYDDVIGEQEVPTPVPANPPVTSTLNFNIGGAICRMELRVVLVPICGNGITEANDSVEEVCDDNHKCCKQDCQDWLPEFSRCDDGDPGTTRDQCVYVEAGIYNEHRKAASNANISAFPHTGCGNGVLDPKEECDDDNYSNGDGCDVYCKLEECGNGIIQMGEQCDDFNVNIGDGCDAECWIEGDGRVQAGIGEECDTGVYFPLDTVIDYVQNVSRFCDLNCKLVCEDEGYCIFDFIAGGSADRPDPALAEANKPTCAPVHKADGAPCDDQESITWNDTCTRGQCIGYGDLAIGAACSTHSWCESKYCDSGYCSFLEVGAGCTHHRQCSHMLCLVDVSQLNPQDSPGNDILDPIGYCAPALPDGSECQYDAQCVDRSCVQGECAIPGGSRDVGEPCKRDTQCKTGICSFSYCAESCREAGCPTPDVSNCLEPGICDGRTGKCKYEQSTAGTACGFQLEGQCNNEGCCNDPYNCVDVVCIDKFPTSPCHEIPTCDLCSGLCLSKPKDQEPDELHECDDGDFITKRDFCHHGSCAGAMGCAAGIEWSDDEGKYVDRNGNWHSNSMPMILSVKKYKFREHLFKELVGSAFGAAIQQVHIKEVIDASSVQLEVVFAIACLPNGEAEHAKDDLQHVLDSSQNRQTGGLKEMLLFDTTAGRATVEYEATCDAVDQALGSNATLANGWSPSSCGPKTPVGVTCTFRCIGDSVVPLFGAVNRTCGGNGKFNGTRLTCVAPDCAFPGKPCSCLPNLSPCDDGIPSTVDDKC